ncbi:uncharacterized protein LOC126580721 [Anopheles aquasalis]|uniref:uncharacterized protein LOC126580721 n=1 Tax=Anopheles aquasalis TaxID=42839 RepID=UPI00215B14F0|nr:uncharacterized protein LOC126580721 [Anopheles aquasalis]
MEAPCTSMEAPGQIVCLAISTVCARLGHIPTTESRKTDPEPLLRYIRPIFQTDSIQIHRPSRTHTSAARHVNPVQPSQDEERRSTVEGEIRPQSATPHGIVFHKVHHHEPDNSIFSLFAATHDSWWQKCDYKV